MSMVANERAKVKTAMEAAEAAKRLAEAEAKRRLNAEMKVLKESDSFSGHSIVRYRKYSVQEIEEGTDNFAESRKVGEGGYGPVFRGHLDHTSVAVKVLRPDAAQGRSQFHKEVNCNLKDLCVFTCDTRNRVCELQSLKLYVCFDT